jgi:hypothetical protein
MALMLSSFAKAALGLMLVWDYDARVFAWMVHLFVLTSNAEALSGARVHGCLRAAAKGALICEHTSVHTYVCVYVCVGGWVGEGSGGGGRVCVVAGAGGGGSGVPGGRTGGDARRPGHTLMAAALTVRVARILCVYRGWMYSAPSVCLAVVGGPGGSGAWEGHCHRCVVAAGAPCAARTTRLIKQRRWPCRVLAVLCAPNTMVQPRPWRCECVRMGVHVRRVLPRRAPPPRTGKARPSPAMGCGQSHASGRAPSTARQLREGPTSYGNGTCTQPA